MKTRVAVMILSFCVVNYPAVSQQPGTIAGTVLDETGNKVVGAHVIVDPLDERPKASALLVVETDIEGKFSTANLALGSYKVFAGKDSAGYPDTSFAFYSNHIFPTISNRLHNCEFSFGQPNSEGRSSGWRIDWFGQRRKR